MNKLSIAFALFMAFQTLSVCQNKKNVIYGTIGMMPNVVYDINYERQIAESYKSSINLRVGFGESGSLVGTEKMALFSSQFLYGLNASRFEFGLGLGYYFDIQRMNFDKETEVQPVANLGFRHVQQNGHFVFRFGAGWPECIYASIGFAL